MEWMYSPTVLTLILLLKLALLVSPSKWEQGYGQKKCTPDPCQKEYYCEKKSNGYRCERCTKPCLAKNHLVEINNCEKFTNRLCHCDKGFYCPDRLEYICLVPCKPCPAGKFSSNTSLQGHCKPHTNCELKGLVTVSKGTATQDSVCVAPPTVPSPPDVNNDPNNETATMPTTHHPSSMATTHHNSSMATTHHPSSMATTHHPSSSDSSSISFHPLDTYPVPLVSISPAANRASALTNTSTPNTRYSTTGSAQHSLRDSLSHPWMVVLMLLLAVSMLVGCFLWSMGKTLRKQLGLTRGLPFGKYQVSRKAGYNICVPQQHLLQQQEADMEANPCLERMMPLSRDGEGLLREMGAEARPHAGQGSTQHVTLDNSGKGESISNTVGSIFIYSPGMVVLGTNASERREEARQEAEEVQHLAPVPQQESCGSSSSSYDQDAVGLSTQEEDDNKELSYPIPASSK